MQNFNNQKKYYTDKEAGLRIGVSRVTIWRWVKKGNFPKPLKLSAGCTRFRLEDIEAWENQLLETVEG
jgi:prophage regulatory protein